MKAFFSRVNPRSRRRGITMIETMVATTIITVSMVGAVGIFMGTATLSAKTIEQSTATMLARKTVEEARNKGFANLVDGQTTLYYDSTGSNPSATSSSTSRFKVVSTVSTDSTTNGVPDAQSLRTILVIVKRKSDDATLETSGSYFCWGGV